MNNPNLSHSKETRRNQLIAALSAVALGAGGMMVLASIHNSSNNDETKAAASAEHDENALFNKLAQEAATTMVVGETIATFTIPAGGNVYDSGEQAMSKLDLDKIIAPDNSGLATEAFIQSAKIVEGVGSDSIIQPGTNVRLVATDINGDHKVEIIAQNADTVPEPFERP